jgi:hypothetical protein
MRIRGTATQPGERGRLVVSLAVGIAVTAFWLLVYGSLLFLGTG